MKGVGSNLEQKLNGMKKVCYTWCKRGITTLPFVILGMIMFVVGNMIGGPANAIIAVGLVLYAGTMIKSRLSIKSYLRSYLVMFISGMLGTFASMSYVSCILLNFVAMFVFIYIFEDEILPKNYFIVGGMFILAQMIPYKFSMIPERLMTFVFSFAMVSFFIFIIKRKVKIPTSDRFVIQGFRELSKQLWEFKEDNATGRNHKELSKLSIDFSKEIYNDVVKQYGVLNEGQTYLFHVMLCLEQIEQIANQSRFYYKSEDAVYFRELGVIFSNAAENNEKDNFKILSEKLTDFLETHHLQHMELEEEFKIIIERLADELSYCKKLHSKKIDSAKGIDFKLNQLKKHFSLQSCRGRFALKAAILNGISFTISYKLPFSRSFWLPLLVYMITCEFHHEETKSALNRVGGTAVGLLVFLSITEFIPNRIRLVLVLFVSIWMLLSSSSQFISMVFATQIAIVSMMPFQMSMWRALGIRLVIVIASALMVWIIGKVLLRTEKHHALSYRKRELMESYQNIADELEKVLLKAENSQYVNELLLEVQLTVDSIQGLAQDQQVIDKEPIDNIILPSCRAFRIEIIHVFMIFHFYDIPDSERDHFLSEIGVLKSILHSIKSRNYSEIKKEDDGRTLNNIDLHLSDSIRHIKQMAQGINLLKVSHKNLS